MMEQILAESEIAPQLIWDTIRQGTLSLEFTPVLLGSALKNKGIQNLLDAVSLYLPSPVERELVTATDISSQEEVQIAPKADSPSVALAFKLIDDEFGQLTYTRIYAGTLNKGDRLINTRTQKKIRLRRLVRIEVDKRQELESATVGEIVGLMGVDSASGDTLCSIGTNLALEGILTPEPVMTLAITPKNAEDSDSHYESFQSLC